MRHIDSEPPAAGIDRTRSGCRLVGIVLVTLALVGWSSLAAPAGQSRVTGTVHAWSNGSFGLRQAGPSGASAPATPPMGTLNQVMRAILFPNANVIFNVQVEDPGAQKPAPKDGGSSFSLTTWGDDLYPRWDVVSYSAVALEESVTLLMKPERRCQNGKPVPTTRPDWIRYTTELADTAKAVYTASQAKNRDAVIDLTDRLNDACANCHNVYRRGLGVDRCVAP